VIIEAGLLRMFTKSPSVFIGSLQWCKNCEQGLQQIGRYQRVTSYTKHFLNPQLEGALPPLHPIIPSKVVPPALLAFTIIPVTIQLAIISGLLPMFLEVLGVELRTTLYSMSHISSSFCSGYFGDRVLLFV
jgi:hypothetical protein